MHFIKDPKQEPNEKWIAGWIKGLPVLSNNEISSDGKTWAVMLFVLKT